MVILVTGGMGFIGSHTVQALTSFGHDCVVTSHRNSRDLGDTVSAEQVNVADREAMLGLGDRHAISGTCTSQIRRSRISAIRAAVRRRSSPTCALGRMRCSTCALPLEPGRSPHGAVVYLDTTRLQTDTGFEPEYDLDRALADYVSWITDDP